MAPIDSGGDEYVEDGDVVVEWVGAFETREDAAAAAFNDERAHLVRERSAAPNGLPVRQKWLPTSRSKYNYVIGDVVDVVEVGMWSRIRVDAERIAWAAVQVLHDQVWREDRDIAFRVGMAAVADLEARIVAWAHAHGLTPPLGVEGVRSVGLDTARRMAEARKEGV